MKSRIASAVLALALVLPLRARAGSYLESVSGDISGDRTAPSSLALDPGDNSISGTVVSGDLDYITLLNATASPIVSLTLTQFDTANPGELAFVAIQAGSQFTEPNTGTQVANLLGYSHIGLPVGTDYLPLLGTGSGAIGFTPPLPGASYTLWIQQTGANPVGYTLDVRVPEPATWALLALWAAALTQRRVSRTLASHKARARSAS